MSKKIFKPILVVMITVFLFGMLSPSIAFANEEVTNSKKTQELADTLEFIFEKASYKDESGNIIGYNTELIEEKYGSSKELDALKETMKVKNTKVLSESKVSEVSTLKVQRGGTVGFNNCVANKITKDYKGLITGSAVGAVAEYLKDKRFLLAAKQLAKLGFKGSVPGLAISLATYVLSCVGK